jgi:hypothetical protein
VKLDVVSVPGDWHFGKFCGCVWGRGGEVGGGWWRRVNAMVMRNSPSKFHSGSINRSPRGRYIERQFELG